LKNVYIKKPPTMNITERVQEVFNRFNVNLTVAENPRTEFAEATLDNGTVVYTDADAFAEGVEAFIINDEGERIPLPAGDYTMEDGMTLSVGDAGVVNAVSEAAEVEAGDDEKEEMTEEVVAENVEEVEASTEPEYMTREDVKSMIVEALTELTADNADKQEMSAQDEQADPMLTELNAIKAELEAVKKQAADSGLKHAEPVVAQEPIDLKKLTVQERVQAIHNQFSK